MKRILIAILMLTITVEMNAQSWEEVEKMVASDRESRDNYGDAVDIEGNYAIVGASGADEDENGANEMRSAGAAYILERNAQGNWQEVQKIVASDRGIDAFFGISVALNGNYIIVGAVGERKGATAPGPIIGTRQGNPQPNISKTTSRNELAQAGAAYVFRRNAQGYWEEVQKIVASDRAQGDLFGGSVSVNGEFVLVGATGQDLDEQGGNNMKDAGAAYLFKRDFFGDWHEVQKLVASDREAPETSGSTLETRGDFFGSSVSINGNYAIIGALFEDEDAAGNHMMDWAGAAYLFEKNARGTWEEVQKIVAADRAQQDLFGDEVAISGNWAIIGARTEGYIPDFNPTGAAYIFERDAQGTWNQVQKLTATAGEMDNYFGSDVDISCNYVVVGAERYSENSPGGTLLNAAGSAYIFERNGTGQWIEVDKLLAADRAENDLFGNSVAIDEAHVIIGAREEDEDSTGGATMDMAGSAYLFSTEEALSIATDFIAPTACGSYQSPSGNFTWTSSGTYVDTVRPEAACDVFVIVDLTINTVDTEVRVSANGTLTAQAKEARYRWLDCRKAFRAIPGAIDRSFTPRTAGDFAVEVSQNNCVDTSTCFSVGRRQREMHRLGDIDSNLKEINCYPNPTQGELNIFLGDRIGANMRVFDLYGRLVHQGENISTSLHQFSLEKRGAYIVEVNYKGESKHFRILRQ